MTAIHVPDIGDFKDVLLIELPVATGDRIEKDQTIAVIETDKATMDIPSPQAGVVQSLAVKAGDRVSRGALLLTLDAGSARVAAHSGAAAKAAASLTRSSPVADTLATEAALESSASPADAEALTVTVPAAVYAGPAVRKLARQLGVDLIGVKSSGPLGRIVFEDVHAYVREILARPTRPAPAIAGSGLPFELPPWPKADHAKFGPVRVEPLSRIRRISGPALHRNWISIPHVTNHDDADITELEAFRLAFNRDNEKQGTKLSPLAFLMKASVSALQAFPQINASLDGENIILKSYYHIGFAADTPNGLVVPVIRDADRKGVVQIAQEMGELAGKARAGKLAPGDMQGGSFSISSLGGIGGSYFTPIINAPEVAILGCGKTQNRVAWIDGQAQPRLYLPLSLSWDHRVIDGAIAGRFNAYLVKLLGDLRRLLL